MSNDITFNLSFDDVFGNVGDVGDTRAKKQNKQKVSHKAVNTNANEYKVKYNKSFISKIFETYLSTEPITEFKGSDDVLCDIKHTNNKLIYSDHAPILYTVDKHEIIVWNIGQWGCEKYSDNTGSTTYNHKYNMDRRETFGEYYKRLQNIISALNELVTKYPDAFFCLQEIPNMICDFNIFNNQTTFIRHTNDKLIAILGDKKMEINTHNNIIINTNNTKIIRELQTHITMAQTYFYTEIENTFNYNNTINKNSSDVLIIHSKQHNIITGIKYLQIDSRFLELNKADGFYYIPNANNTELIAFISVHMKYVDEKSKNTLYYDNNKNSIEKLFGEIIKKIKSIKKITVYMCGDFNIPSEGQYHDNCMEELIKKISDIFVNNGIVITLTYSSICDNSTTGSALSDNKDTNNKYIIDYIIKINIDISHKQQKQHK